MQKIVLTFAAAALAAAASAYTVYDAGKALRQNCASGAPVGADGSTYTDENGGKWQYLLANDRTATATVSFGKSVASGTYRGIGGNSSGAGSPYIHVNATANPIAVSGGEPIEPDEFYVHPGNPNAANHYAVIRFVVPEDGWYSAFITAHDANKGTSVDKWSGAEVSLVANNILQARGVVSLEDYTGTDGASYLLTHRFDFQMPTRWMAANETLDVVVGANGSHTSDATGLKVFVTKEDEGRFYDSGISLDENLSGSSLNPFGTTALGMWYCCYADTSVPQSQAGAATACPADVFAAWAPGRLTKKLTLLDASATRTTEPLFKGFFMSDRIGSSPFVCANQTSATASNIAPHELYTHPHAGNWVHWTTLRFRPPRGGLYSASVVLRDVARNVAEADSDGVMAYLLVGEKVVTNAVVSAESSNATAHFTFDARLVAANEPIDIVVSPHNGHASDATTISAIFRREADAYDAGYAMATLAKANGGAPTKPFADALGGGATWDVGNAASPQGTFATMPYAFKRVNNDIDFLGYGQNATDGSLPRVMISTNGIAQLYNATDSKMYRMAPCEMWAHPNNSGDKCPFIRATVPADGIYHARAYARDIAIGGDGIRMSLTLGVSSMAEMKALALGATPPYEAAVDGDRLWLRAGATLDAVIDPADSHTSDGTGLSVCYIKESDADANRHVVNVHFTESGNGKLSATGQRPREGWADWNKWNALRPFGVSSATCRNCVEADGTTPRNVTVSLTRDSGATIAKGTGPAGTLFLESFVASSGTDDTYTFTVGNLKKNEPYTLYLYSVKNFSTDDLGNATFTVGGATKGLEGAWILGGGQKVLTRFDVTSDANGTITGTFAAADANGGAFNGLTLVGDLPAYVATGTMVIVR